MWLSTFSLNQFLGHLSFFFFWGEIFWFFQLSNLAFFAIFKGNLCPICDQVNFWAIFHFSFFWGVFMINLVLQFSISFNFQRQSNFPILHWANFWVIFCFSYLFGDLCNFINLNIIIIIIFRDNLVSNFSPSQFGNLPFFMLVWKCLWKFSNFWRFFFCLLCKILSYFIAWIL